jgi:hypothetical protein
MPNWLSTPAQVSASTRAWPSGILDYRLERRRSARAPIVAANAMATTPPTASALLSETADPPPPVFGAPDGIAPPPLLELLFAPEEYSPVELDEDLLDELLELEELPAPAAGAEVDFFCGSGTATVDPPLPDFGVAVAVDELPDKLPPEDEFIFMPGMLSIPVMLPVEEFDEPEELEPLLGAALWRGAAEADAAGAGTATVLPPLDLVLDDEEDEDDVEDAEPLADVDLAGGSVTATVLPPLPVDFVVAEAAGLADACETVAEALGAAAVGAAEAPLEEEAGAPALLDVSFWDHSPISDNTPARTAIAMIAPTTQDVLLGCSSPPSPWSSGSLFGFAIFAPVAMVYAESVGPKR